MRGSGTSGWTRRRERRRRSARRLVAAGAWVGLLGGLLAQFVVGDVPRGELEGLVRFALVLPAGIFVAWWLAFPGLALDRDEPQAAATHPVDAQERLRHIEATFDAAGVPAAPTRLRAGGTESSELLSRSIRRPAPPAAGAAEHPAATYRIRRPG